ncbi:MAG: Sec-independent protein translocase subunit TatA [Acidobacteria bacterium]|nr:Sec-independent protein translocase subunit TatA [Acidobacteriota bacterium]
MGKLFENPAVLIVLIVVVILLFAAPRLPGMARSLGQSMRIIKSEVKEMKNDGKPQSGSGTNGSAADSPMEGKIVNDPPRTGEPRDGGTPPSTPQV